jgi:hypothetical protein
MTIETLEAKIDAWVAKMEADAKTVSKTTIIVGIVALVLGILIGKVV